ncbi:MAG: NTP transferase domain-containing protein [Gemmatimonadales bacterium]
MTNEPALFALLLAAGEARRFGGAKLLRPHRGRPLVAYALDTLAQARSDGLLQGGIAVIPERNTALRQLARDRGLRVVMNGDPGRGLSHSLRLGLAALDTMALIPSPTAALIFLGDQPRVPMSALTRVVAAWRAGAGPVIHPAYPNAAEAPGHPFILMREAWPLATELEGDTGFGPILARRPELLTTVAVDGQNPDIDTAEDLARLDEE